MDKITEITKDSVIVLTPFGSPMGWVNYFMSLMKLREECRDNDVKLNYFFEKNASLITHARNDMVNNFLLNTTAEYMIFIDSDVEFDPTYVVKWVKEKRDFASGTYPIKKYEPELIDDLIDMGLKMVKDGIKIKDGMLVTERVATGFMFLSRKLLLEMIEKADTMPSSYNFNAYNLENSYANIKGQVGYTFFDCMMLGNTAIGEDYAFCERLKFIGKEILVDPNIKLNHWGFNSYNGHLVRKFKENK